eukprot:EG_transcript_32931
MTYVDKRWYADVPDAAPGAAPAAAAHHDAPGVPSAPPAKPHALPARPAVAKPGHTHPAAPAHSPHAPAAPEVDLWSAKEEPQPKPAAAPKDDMDNFFSSAPAKTAEVTNLFGAMSVSGAPAKPAAADPFSADPFSAAIPRAASHGFDSDPFAAPAGQNLFAAPAAPKPAAAHDPFAS